MVRYILPSFVFPLVSPFYRPFLLLWNASFCLIIRGCITRSLRALMSAEPEGCPKYSNLLADGSEYSCVSKQKSA